MMNGIFLMTHKKIAQAHCAAVTFVLGESPENVDFLEMGEKETPDNCESVANQKIQQLLEKTDGVLLLTDLMGASPFNLAKRFIAENVVVVSGLNLAMLLRAFNYRNLPLKELAEKVREGGLASVMIFKGEERVAP